MARPAVGWIKLHRKILQSWIGQDPIAAWMLVTLVIWARREPGIDALPRQLVTLERGQVATSTEELRAHLKTSAKKIEVLLKSMAQDGTLAVQRSNCGTIITVLNYDRYQLAGSDEGKTKGVAKGKTKGVAKGKTRFDSKPLKNEGLVALESLLGKAKGKTKGGAKGKTKGVHREKARSEKKDLKVSANFHGAKIERDLSRLKGAISDTARARNAVLSCVGLLRSQYEIGRDGDRPGIERPEAEQQALSLPAETLALLRLKYPTWTQFVSAYTHQSQRGFGPVFERELVADFRSALKAGRISGSDPQGGRTIPGADAEGSPYTDDPPPHLDGDMPYQIGQD